MDTVKFVPHQNKISLQFLRINIIFKLILNDKRPIFITHYWWYRFFSWSRRLG